MTSMRGERIRNLADLIEQARRKARDEGEDEAETLLEAALEALLISPISRAGDPLGAPLDTLGLDDAAEWSLAEPGAAGRP
jgi:hypothetical protein